MDGNKQEAIVRKIRELGPWVHQIEVAPGLLTRTIAPSGIKPPNHPRSRWRILQTVIPKDLTGMRVLDIGCADGFFALEMAKRGAEVTAVDFSAKSIARLNFVIAEQGLSNITTRVDRIESFENSNERYDFVLMIALLYHLRNPFLGLELMRQVTDTLYVETVVDKTSDAPCMFLRAPVAGVHKIPKWMPTETCVIDMLRFAGFSEVQVLQKARSFRGIYLARASREPSKKNRVRPEPT